MGLQLILGRAGSGKTRTCLQEIRRALLEGGPAGPALILIVPEQSTLQMELALVQLPELAGTERAQVLSFHRLAWRVFSEAGGANCPSIGEAGKIMAIQAILGQLENQLQLFGRTARLSGFANRLAGILSEFHTYNIQPEVFLERYSALSPSGKAPTKLALKLRDLILVYSAWKEYLAGRYTDPDEYLTLAACRLAQAGFLRGARVWLDGFNGFTPQEYLILGTLLRLVAQVKVTLCLDGRQLLRPPSETDLFYPTRETYQRLTGLAREYGTVIGKPLVLDRETMPPPRFAVSPELALLEALLFRPAGCKNQPVAAGSTECGAQGSDPAGPVSSSHGRELPGYVATGQPPAVSLLVATNPRSEVQAVARELIRLARDKGYRWREMAVITRNLKPYADLVQNIFTDYEIPCFIDHRRPISHHPLAEFLRSSLEIVISDWAYDPLFRLLKTDLVPISRGEVDELENYVLAHGLRGSSIWFQDEDWNFHRSFSPLLAEEEAFRLKSEQAEYLARINSIRRNTVALLEKFWQALKPWRIIRTGSGRIRNTSQEPSRKVLLVIYQLMEDLGVPGTLDKWRQDALAGADLLSAQEHGQTWNAVLELLDELSDTQGDNFLTLEELASILEAGLESLHLGLIPPGLDQVVVGSVERSRNPNVRAAFVLGLNEGLFPARLAENELLNDREREDLLSCGLELAPSSRRRLLREQFLAYLALTRASHHLVLSYSLADAAGRALQPSPILSLVREILPDLNERREGREALPAVGSSSQGADAGGGGPDSSGIASGSRPWGQEVELESIARPRQCLAHLVIEVRRSLTTGGFLPHPWLEVRKELGRYLAILQGADGVPARGTGALDDELSCLILASLSYLNDTRGLDRELVGRLYLRDTNPAGYAPSLRVQGMPSATTAGLVSSASRLERFAACPFAHYAAYGLRLQERPSFRLEAPGIGIFLHSVLRQFVERLQSENLDWAELSYQEQVGRVDDIVDRTIPQLQSEILLSTARYRYLGQVLRRTCQRAVAVLGEHVRRGSFRPLGVELRFGLGGRLPALVLDLEGSAVLLLQGQIDRLDGAQDKCGNWYLRVIDYKSGNRDLHPDGVYYGQSLQLSLYLAVVQEYSYYLGLAKPVRPAGLFYFALDDPLIRTSGPLSEEEAAQRLRQRLRLRGFVADREDVLSLIDGGSGGVADLVGIRLTKGGRPVKGSGAVPLEHLDALADFGRNLAVDLGRSILAGETGISPIRRGIITACSQCQYHPVCQFDPALEGNSYRFQKPLDREEAWHRIIQKAGKGSEQDLR